MTGLSHHPSLDGVRGIAVLNVVMAHAQALIFGRPIFGWFDFSGGFIGVDIFFVLSGFLITGLLLQEHQITGTISLKNFYIRRALRLLPALVFLLVAMVVFSRFALSAEIAGQTLKFAGVVILYITNWARAFEWIPGSDLLGHLWSLAVEEQFYLLWPPVLLILLRHRLPRRTLVILIACLIVIVIVRRVDLLIQGGISQGRTYLGSDTRADSLLVGCLVAMLHNWRMLPDGKVFRLLLRTSTVISIPVLFIYFVDAYRIRSLTYFTIGLTIVALAVGVVILQAMQNSPNPLHFVLENGFLVYIGKISYGLYLWHFFAIEITLGLRLGNVMKLVLSLLALFAITGASFYCLERPFLRLKSRFGSDTPTSSVAPKAIDSALVNVQAS
ncbi:MAG TPA: acyltransferase [Pyrinomonadaceae bacterium]|jgi:Predicted acyltransferases|nr:acyltransferase [Pyrinomonadaceae bacterium]